MRRLLVAVALLCALGQVPVVAQANLRDSRPPDGAHLTRAPQFLRLAFDAPLEFGSGGLSGRIADARLHGFGALAFRLPILPTKLDPQVAWVRLPGVLPAGAYRVSWRVMTEDGHVVDGSTALRVGSSPAAVPVAPRLAARPGVWAAGVGRAVILVGLLVATGLVVLRWLVSAPAWAAGGLVPPGRPDDAETFRDRAASALRLTAPGWWLAWSAALGASLIGVAVVCVATLVALHDGPRDLGELLTATRLGSAMFIIAWCCVLALAVGVMRRPHLGPGPGIAAAAALALPPVAGLGAMSWLGHAGVGTDATLNIGADLLHNLATAAWIGGLVGLAVYVLPAGRRMADADRLRFVAPAVVRFSTLALASVAVLVVTGVYRALAEVASVGDLTGTTYGRALLVKLGLFALMLCVGGVNRFRLHPRLERAALDLPGGDPAAAGALARSVRAELVLAAAVLVAVGVLINTA